MAIKFPEPQSVPDPGRRHRRLSGRYPTLREPERRELFEARSFTQLKQIFPDQRDEVLHAAAEIRADLLEQVYKADSVDLAEVRENSERILNLVANRNDDLEPD
jgi:hypothetical protein